MPETETKTTYGFRSCSNKGFHFQFKNGWTVSVQFGPGNYCENYDLPWSIESITKKPDMQSVDAEVYCWNSNGKHWPDEPLSKQSPEQVLRILNKISKKQSADAEGKR